MPGTKAGSKKMMKTMREKYGEEGLKEFYRTIGAKGGRNGHTGGFAANRELAREAGRKGGTISRRRPSKNIPEPEPKETFLGRIFRRK